MPVSAYFILVADFYSYINTDTLPDALLAARSGFLIHFDGFN